MANITERIPNALPFVSAKDPRVPTLSPTTPKPFDGATPLKTQQALRTSGQKIGPLTVAAMPALTTVPATKSDAVDLLFREAAFWEFGRGQRLPNLRREIRLYGKMQDQIFPTGTFHKGGTFGTDVNIPVPDAELTNPNFHGCIDRKA